MTSQMDSYDESWCESPAPQMIEALHHDDNRHRGRIRWETLEYGTAHLHGVHPKRWRLRCSLFLDEVGTIVPGFGCLYLPKVVPYHEFDDYDYSGTVVVVLLVRWNRRRGTIIITADR